MQKGLIVFILVLTTHLYFSQSIKGFHIPDSLKSKNADQLQKAYEKVFRIDNDKAEIYANSILSKGKSERNNTLIYDGYYKLAYSKGLKSENGHPYADTLLTLTQKVNTEEFPAKAHIIKGILLNYEFKYDEALNHYVQARDLSRNKNPEQFYYIKKLVGILKLATNENEEALPLFLEYYQYEKKRMTTDDKNVKSYIGAIFSVANCYNRSKQYTNALQYINLGIQECEKYKDYTHYPYFISGSGIANYYLKNYKKSEENHLEAEQKFIKNNDTWNLGITYYFLGKINTDVNKEEEGIKYFTKADSVLSISKKFDPVTRNGYEVLIDYYKKQGDKENQLKFINKLFVADSIMNNSKQYLSKEIYKKYDTPALLEEKEVLIADLNNKNSMLYIFLGGGFLIIGVLLFLFIRNRKKIEQYKRQADQLLEKSKSSEIIVSQDFAQVENETKVQKTKNILSDEKLQDIKIKLDEFEKNKGFLRKNITVDSLAKDFGSNRDYLSKSVNELKEKNFSQYLNELRINYIVEELNHNEKIRKHTIAAIADDIGYNNSESFSNAFRKITGTLPSYYIKLLQKQD
ncbi:helix-turn-helix domain-containing protein [Chryseobacterium joostei]|uniref:helix-turn-helix domain-containing protein n=1 Tax=Chryseobacterium joostei TaxID=112234 RepID=UPI003D1099E8